MLCRSDDSGVSGAFRQVRKGKAIDADKRALAKDLEDLRAQLTNGPPGGHFAVAEVTDDTSPREATEAARREGAQAAAAQHEARDRALNASLAAFEVRAASAEDGRRAAEQAADAAEARAAEARSAAQRLERELAACRDELAQAQAAAAEAAAQ